MTPDEARELLKNTTPGDEWVYRVKGGGVLYVEPVTVIPGGGVDVTEEDAALIVAAPDMATMIAGMNEEWGVVWPADKTSPEWIAWGFTTIEDAYEHTRDVTVPGGAPDIRIVRRYVTEPEEIS